MTLRHHGSKDAPSLAASAVPLKPEIRDRISFFHLLCGRQNSGLSVTFLYLFEKCYSKRMSNKKSLLKTSEFIIMIKDCLSKEYLTLLI